MTNKIGGKPKAFCTLFGGRAAYLLSRQLVVQFALIKCNFSLSL